MDLKDTVDENLIGFGETASAYGTSPSGKANNNKETTQESQKAGTQDKDGPKTNSANTFSRTGKQWTKIKRKGVCGRCFTKGHKWNDSDAPCAKSKPIPFSKFNEFIVASVGVPKRPRHDFVLQDWEDKEIEGKIRGALDFEIQRCIQSLLENKPNGAILSLARPFLQQSSELRTDVAVHDLKEMLIKLYKKWPEKFADEIFCQLNHTYLHLRLVPQRRGCIYCKSFKRGISHSLKDFEVPARHGCPSCRLIYAALDQLHHSDLSGDIYFVHLDSVGLISFGVFSPSSKSVKIDIWIESGNNPDKSIFASKPRFFPKETSSLKSFQKVLDWLQKCESHENCTQEDSSFLPTRVIDVGDYTTNPAQVRVRETRGFKGHYVTLSHCWGASDPACKTTKMRYERNKAGIPWTTLSQTFRDAIHFTRRLGIRYLWIDSICIIQDDEKDWERESATMSSVYQNSFLTLAATKGHSSEDGLYSNSGDFTSTMPVQVITPDETLATVYIQRVLHFTEILTDDQKLANFPLLTRGWVYQERSLSPRVLHFCAHELVWECREYTECMCTKRLHKFDSMIRISEKPDPSGDDLIPYWRRIVFDYTQLSLTVPSDVLPAISGIARKMNHKLEEINHKPHYLAGLWEEKLVGGLLWRRAGSALEKRPNPLLAPTWSWASISPPRVEYPNSFDVPPLVTIHKVNCTPASEDPMGHVKSGTLQLSGSCIRFVFKHRYSKDLPEQENYVFFDEKVPDLMDRRWRAVYLDYDMAGDPADDFYVPDGTNIYCLRLSKFGLDDRDDSTPSHYYCILLRKVEDEDVWERIGYAEIFVHLTGTGDPFNKSEEKTMTIH